MVGQNTTTRARLAQLLAERGIAAAAVERRAGGSPLRSPRTGGRPIDRPAQAERPGRQGPGVLVERRAVGPLRSVRRPDREPRPGPRLHHLRAGLLDLHLNRTATKMAKVELRGRAIARAFGIERSTAIYSGILRMADLIALQPDMDIRLHIVAPTEPREQVFTEIKRPVFLLLDRGPLAESSTFISYDSVIELSRQRHLRHLADMVLDEYAGEAD